MLEISAFDITPNDNDLTKQIFAFLDEAFKAEDKILLKETNKIYQQSNITDLADTIVSLHEERCITNKKGETK